MIKRAALPEAAAHIARAAELLHCAAHHSATVRYKVAQMRAAAHWFALALVALLVTASVFLAYVVADDHQHAKSKTPASRTT